MMLAKVNIYYRFHSLIVIHKANYQNWSVGGGGKNLSTWERVARRSDQTVMHLTSTLPEKASCCVIQIPIYLQIYENLVLVS